MEAEIGFTQNEPVQLAVTEAIEKAVKSLIVEGVRDNIWGKTSADPAGYKNLIDNYNIEEKDNDKRILGNKYPNNDRQKFALFTNIEGQQVKGDYVNPKANFGMKAGFKYFLNDHVNLEVNAGVLTIENENIIKRTFVVSELNLEYLILPNFKFSPFIYAGGGTMFFSRANYYKAQLGGGLEYLIDKNIAVRLSSQYDIGFKDSWDGFVHGNNDDQAIRVGLGVNIYIGN